MNGKICSVSDGGVYYEQNPAHPLRPVEHPRTGDMYHGHPGTDFQCRCSMVMWDPEIDGDYEVKDSDLLERKEAEEKAEKEAQERAEAERREKARAEQEKAAEALRNAKEETRRAETERKAAERARIEAEKARKEAEEAARKAATEARKARLEAAAVRRHAARTPESEAATIAAWNARRIRRIAETRHAARTVEKRAVPVGKDAKTEIPKTLATLSEAIEEYKVNGYYSDDFKDSPSLTKLAEDAMKGLLEKNDFGMAIRANVLEKVFNNGFLNTFETGTSGAYNGSTKTTGAIEANHDRLKAAHRMFFGKNSGMHYSKGKEYLGPQLQRSEYEKYGYVIQKDKLAALRKRLKGYGNCQVRFKKERVRDRTTWQLGDSLQNINAAQPSPVTKPSAVSLDDMITLDAYGKMKLFDDPLLVVDSILRKSTDFFGEKNPYIELQYHGRLTMDDVESVTFLKPPRDKAPVKENDDWISKDLADRLVDKGIEIFYKEGKELKQYRK